MQWNMKGWNENGNLIEYLSVQLLLFLNLTLKIFLLLLKRLSHAKVFIIAEEKTDSDQYLECIIILRNHIQDYWIK